MHGPLNVNLSYYYYYYYYYYYRCHHHHHHHHHCYVLGGVVFELCDWTRDYAASYSVVPGNPSAGRKLAGV